MKLVVCKNHLGGQILFKKYVKKRRLTNFQYSFRFFASVEERRSLAVGKRPVMSLQQIGLNGGGIPLHANWRSSERSVWSRLIREENFSDRATSASVNGGKPAIGDFGTGPTIFILRKKFKKKKSKIICSEKIKKDEIKTRKTTFRKNQNTNI